MRKEMAIASGIALVLLASSATAAPRYSQVGTVTGQPEVKDAKTNLIWQGCPMGQSGSDCATGGASNYNWHDALAACANLSWGAGANAWRLPNIKELQTIINDLVSYPAIDSTNFPVAAEFRCLERRDDKLREETRDEEADRIIWSEG